MNARAASSFRATDKGNSNRDAIEVFKLNVEMFPQAFNTYDSLAEAYAVDGQTEPAIENYRRSLQLNPQNNNAVERLKALEKK